ncbi:hydrogenase maturation protease [Infirmifilum sp. NZ]|uniref:hydrogenase maturation protease n=1 Tax=Infirmifilum sp. NZ TaxID=2926850 RepID=UPI0027AAB806|nr:hydrogenase maturation protease [Infirmifilum sp. NZ]UNQ72646.1 hydrogenase maturation protease [Infirmifilum sp. NZ]
MTKPYLVIGIGNEIFGDDAIGPLLADALAECGVNAIAAGLDAFTTASYLEGVPRVVFIDVLDESFGSKGEVVKIRLDPRRLSAYDIVDAVNWEISAHVVSPAHIVALGYASGKFTGEAWVIGPVSGNIDFGSPPSEDVIIAAEKVVSELESLIGERIDRGCLREKLERKLAELKSRLFDFVNPARELR